MGLKEICFLFLIWLKIVCFNIEVWIWVWNKRIWIRIINRIHPKKNAILWSTFFKLCSIYIEIYFFGDNLDSLALAQPSLKSDPSFKKERIRIRPQYPDPPPRASPREMCRALYWMNKEVLLLGRIYIFYQGKSKGRQKRI